MKFGIGVLGATGYIGTPYRREIRESPLDARIVALHGRRRDLLEAAGKEDQAQLVTDDWRQVVDHPEVNLIVVCTPDAYHREAVMRCAALGKHLICEKPIGANAKEAKEMWDAVRKTGAGHYVPFWTRYVPVCVRAREIVRQGILGQIRAAVYRWHNPRPSHMPFTWRDDTTISSAGIVADVGSHAYDTLCWMLETEATRVMSHAKIMSPAKPDVGEINLAEAISWGQSGRQSRVSQNRPVTAFDYGSIAFELNAGIVGLLLVSNSPFLRKGLAPEIELHGSDASLAVDRIRSTVTLFQPGDATGDVEFVTDPGPVNRFSQYVFPSLRNRIAGQITEHPGMDDGYRAQLFTDAAAQSAFAGTWIVISPNTLDKQHPP